METILIISSVVLWITVIFNLLLTFALVRKANEVAQPRNMPQPDMLEVGAQAPEFVAETLDGHEITQADYTGKERAMVFVSSTCGPCRQQMPKLQQLYPKAQKAGVELMIFNMEDINTTQAYVEELQLQVPILAAPRGTNPLNETYKVPGTPSYYVIDQKGKIAAGGFFDEKWHQLVSQW